MEKGLLFFTLSLLCLWVILDEFFGDKKLLSGIALKLTPQSTSLQAVNHEEANKAKETIKKEIEKDDSLNKAEKEYKLKFWDKFFENSEVH